MRNGSSVCMCGGGGGSGGDEDDRNGGVFGSVWLICAREYFRSCTSYMANSVCVFH